MSLLREQIRKRAQLLGELSSELMLNYDVTNPEVATAYRYSYLVLRKPKQYLQQFNLREDLFIALDEVNHFIWENWADLNFPSEPYKNLMKEEEDIIHRHNYESQSWLQRSRVNRNSNQYSSQLALPASIGFHSNQAR